MQRKQYSIEYMKRNYRGKYQTTILQDDIKMLLIEPELEELESKFNVNYINNINPDFGVKKREYYIKKFLSKLLNEVNVEKTKIDDKNEKIIKYWLKYVKDFKVDELYEREIIEDSLYKKLQCKQNLFIDIIEDNNKKELLLLDKEISPEKLGFRSEFTKLLLEQLVENINNKSKDNDRLIIAVVNDTQGSIKDNLVSKIKNVERIILLDDYYNNEILKEELLGKFDHIISVNFLHRIEKVETFFKSSKLMLKKNGKLHVIDFGKMDPVSILIAIFFQEKYLDIETEKRKQFFYSINYIKKLAETYFPLNTLFSIENDIAYYFESESYTNYLELIKNLANDIGANCAEKSVLLSSEYLDSDNCRGGIIKAHINNYNENMEEVLKTIWIQNLEVDNIERNSNYFKLGGNSLSATKLLVEIEKRLKCKLMLNEIFVNPEFESLLNLIDAKQKNTEIVEGEI